MMTGRNDDNEESLLYQMLRVGATDVTMGPMKHLLHRKDGGHVGWNPGSAAAGARAA